MNTSSAQAAWLAGLTSPTGNNSSSAVRPAGVTEAEFRWHTPPGSGSEGGGGCSGTGGQGAWLMAPSGKFNTEHPLSPQYGSGGSTPVPTYDEWGQHGVVGTSESCTPEGINSRTAIENRKVDTGSGVGNYVPPGSPGGAAHHPRSFEYDAAGNVKFDGRWYYQYDGGNRLKDVFETAWSTSGAPSQGFRRAHFDYDGFGRLVKSQHDTDADGSLSDEDTEWTPRDHLGRVMGIWRQAPTSGVCAKPYQVFAYHNTSFRGEGSDDSRGVLDAPAVRWRDTGSGDLTEVVSYLQDFRGDVRALVHPSYGIVERERYGLTGIPEAFPAADVNFDGVVDEDDKNDFDQAHKYFGIDPATYDPRADLDRDGDVDDDDETLFNSSNGFYSGYSGQWKLSAGPGLTPGHNGAYAGLDNRFGWRGYWYDPHLQVYHVRNRAYDPRQGQFLQTDPLGFGAGDQNLYRYANGNFSSGYDPLGLDDSVWWGFTKTFYIEAWRAQIALLDPMAPVHFVHDTIVNGIRAEDNNARHGGYEPDIFDYGWSIAAEGVGANKVSGAIFNYDAVNDVQVGNTEDRIYEGLEGGNQMAGTGAAIGGGFEAIRGRITVTTPRAEPAVPTPVGEPGVPAPSLPPEIPAGQPIEPKVGSSPKPAQACPDQPAAAPQSNPPNAGTGQGQIRFKRWARGEPIDKPMPDGSNPSWDTVRDRYWKNRYEAAKNTGEFLDRDLDRMNAGNAPQDYNPRTGQWESRELHHEDPQRNGGSNGPRNLREVTPDQHRALDPHRR